MRFSIPVLIVKLFKHILLALLSVTATMLFIVAFATDVSPRWLFLALASIVAPGALIATLNLWVQTKLLIKLRKMTNAQAIIYFSRGDAKRVEELTRHFSTIKDLPGASDKASPEPQASASVGESSGDESHTPVAPVVLKTPMRLAQETMLLHYGPRSRWHEPNQHGEQGFTRAQAELDIRSEDIEQLIAYGIELDRK